MSDNLRPFLERAQGHARILVVDDDPGQLELQIEILKQIPHCTLLGTRTGEAALEIIAREPLDLLLLDKGLPDCNGDEICHQVRKVYDNQLLPIIMVTGMGDSENLRSSLEKGANDFIKKPFNAVELLSRAKAALERKHLVDQLDNAESVLFTLAKMVEARDPTTGEHCNRLDNTSLHIGRAVGLKSEELMALKKGAILHDIGKIAIPDEILLKPGRLTESEWQVMKTHSEVGANLCAQLNSIRDAVPIIRHHHERWDGSGYPDGLRGEEIPLLARVFQCADIFDALRYRRVYSGPMSRERIIEIFEQELASGWRDPDIGRLFLDMLNDNPDQFNAGD